MAFVLRIRALVAAVCYMVTKTPRTGPDMLAETFAIARNRFAQVLTFSEASAVHVSPEPCSVVLDMVTFKAGQR